MRYALIFSAAAALHAQTIGMDTHIDTAQRVLIDRTDITQRSPVGHVDIPRLKEGGVNAPFFALWVPAYYKGPEAIRRTLDLRDAMQRVFDTHPELIAAALTAADVERITRSGRIAAILTLEGGHQIDNDLAVLRMYHRLGIRAMTLTHFRNNDWADSSTDKPAHNGLTAFGKEVVKEMNRIGMIVDVSHVSDKTFYDTLAVTYEAGDRDAFLLPRAFQRASQYDRRHAARAGQERRRGGHQLRRRISQSEGCRDN